MDEDLIHDLFASLAPVRVTRMFGGQGIYADGLIVALVVDGELMMKADGECAGAFEAAGARQWSYTGKKRAPVRMPYWSLPDEAYDEASVMADYAALSMAAARRAHETKAAKPARRSRPAARAGDEPG